MNKGTISHNQKAYESKLALSRLALTFGGWLAFLTIVSGPSFGLVIGLMLRRRSADALLTQPAANVNDERAADASLAKSLAQA